MPLAESRQARLACRRKQERSAECVTGVPVVAIVGCYRTRGIVAGTFGIFILILPW
jgi:hypothetical protein